MSMLNSAAEGPSRVTSVLTLRLSPLFTYTNRPRRRTLFSTQQQTKHTKYSNHSTHVPYT